MRTPQSQRGEGKVGCIISLLVLGILGGAAYRLVPVLYSNNELVSAAENIASRAGILPQTTIELQLRQKAQELRIPEALAPGALQITKSGDHIAGNCTVKIRYTRKIDFFGVYTHTLETNKSMNIGYMDAR